MPVTVSLLELACVPGARHLWPSEFEAFVKAIEEAPDERTPFGVLADWLDEPERNEGLFAQAFRFLAKRPKVRVVLQGRAWHIDNLPSVVRWSDGHSHKCDWSTIAGAVADLAFKLEQAMKELE